MTVTQADRETYRTAMTVLERAAADGKPATLTPQEVVAVLRLTQERDENLNRQYGS